MIQLVQKSLNIDSENAYKSEPRVSFMVQDIVLGAAIGTIYEGIISAVGLVLLVLVIKRYREKKNELTRQLFWVMFFLIMGIVWSWLAEVSILYFQEIELDPNIRGYWFFGRVTNWRFSFFFITLGVMMSYYFKTMVYQEEVTKSHSIFIIAYGIVAECVIMFLFDPGAGPDGMTGIMYDLVAFIMVFVYVLIVYAGFIAKMRKLSTRAEIPEAYRKAFRALMILSLTLIGSLLFAALDRVIIMIINERYTIAYFLSWASALVANLSAYYGYLKPIQEKGRLEK